MFDTTINKRTEHIPYAKSVTVTEHKAPTDASIKLYEEIKDRAYKSIIDSIKINNNDISFSAISYRDAASFMTKARYKIIINGKENTGEINLDQGLIDMKGNEYLVKEIIENVSKHITAIIGEAVFKSITKP
jgi:hypothetical protein